MPDYCLKHFNEVMGLNNDEEHVVFIEAICEKCNGFAPCIIGF